MGRAMGFLGFGKKKGATATDPVCGMAVDPVKAAGSIEHGGVTYHFCSPNCMGSFRQNPPRYTQKAATGPASTH